MHAQADEATPLTRPCEGSEEAQQPSYEAIGKGLSASEAQGSSDEEFAASGSCDGSSANAPVSTGIASIIAVLLLGEFISNADATLIMAATGPISSEFDRLQDANWLSTAYTLGLCAAQPMYGKLSDIYGRKPLLLASYFFLAFGCVICGVASLMSVMILGRVISGIGGAGVMAMSSIIITDIVPKREVATWRAYVNISMTLGRSIGGPLGGWLTDTIGWRWLFLLQAPMMAIAALLVIFLLQLTRPRITPLSGDNSSSIRRVDFLGTALLATSIVGITLLFDRGGQAFPWISLSALALASIALVTLATFVYVETYVALEPIFDLRILRRPNVVSSYLIGSLQICAQIGMMFTVPLYFQVTESASATVAGAHLIPAVIGNTIGGLMAGAFIRRTGQYKPVVVMAGFVASIAYVLLYLRWNGHTGFWESLYIFPGGMGTAFASAAAFVTMTSFLEPEEVAMATGGYILLFSFALTAGVTAANTVLGLEFKRQMELKLSGPGAQKIIQRAMSDTQYIAGLKGHVRQIVVGSYIAGLKHTYIISFACSILASIIGLAVRNHRL